MGATADNVVVHRHFEMGVAPYRLVGVWSAPSTSVLEVNPTAYNLAMASAPRSCRGTCDHCGTGIIHHFIIRDSRRNDFVVGSSCVEKVGDAKLMKACEAKQREMAKAKREAKREAEMQARHAAAMAELDAQRARNGGLTDAEVAQQEREQAEQARQDQREEAAEYFIVALEENDTDFARSVARDLRNGSLPYGGGKKILIKIATKYHSGASRVNSKAYDAELDKADVAFEGLKALTTLFR